MRRVVLAILTVCLAVAASAQQQLERDSISGSSGQVLTYNVKLAADAFTFEYVLGGSPASASIVLQACMRGGTCDTIETNTSTTNTKRTIQGVYDYFSFAPTFTGGSSPTLKVNVTGMVAGDYPGALTAANQTVTANQGAANATPWSANVVQWGGNTALTGGSNGSVGVGGLAASGAATSGNPVLIAGRAGTGNAQSIATDGSGVLAMAESATPADAIANTSAQAMPQSPTSGTGYWGTLPFLFNNSTWDRARSGNTANLPNLIGSTLVAPVTVDPCASPSVAKSSAKVTLSSTTAQELVVVSGSTVISVCGFAATIQGSATTVGTLAFEYGTKTTNGCDTGTTTLTSPFAGNINANVPTSIAYGGGGSTIFSTAAAKELCAVATGTTISVAGVVTYVQQ